MEKGYNNSILYRKKNILFGINFGADSTSGHEWGIKVLRQKFGIPDDAYGLQKRQITKLYDGLEWVETKSFSGFWTKPYKDAKIENYRISAVQLYTAWNENTFGVFSNDPHTIKQLRSIYDAICRLDVAIWIGGGGLFQNAGLVICIASIIPKETTN